MMAQAQTAKVMRGAQLRAARPARAQGARKVVARKGLSVRAVVSAPAVDAQVMQDSVNCVRFLAIDSINKSNSGHPGLPMGCAPMGVVLYREFMQHNPKNPKWFNRDRFVLSAGHGCMLQYALMHLTGYDAVTSEQLQQFRQWDSLTPGHPENFVTPGIEVTTGPLGNGIAMAVGLACAEAHLAARFNKPDCEIVDHYTYCIMGDGCNMEGVSQEAVSYAGHQGLGKLIALYDDNSISIDGHTDISFTEDVCARYVANGWHVQHVEDGNTDYDAIRKAVEAAKKVTDKPSLIKITTLIGYCSPNKANSHDVHGAPLGADETAATREQLGWNYGPWEVPESVKEYMGAQCAEGAAAEAEWNSLLDTYTSKYPEEAAEFKQLISCELPAGWEKALPTFTPEDKGVATRIHSQTMLNTLAPVLPGFMGGSADLAPSNMTLMKMFGDFQKDTPEERNFRFGVREHGMGAIANGLALHASGIIPYCATFFIFSDYMRAAMRMAALMECGTIFVMTHDSIGVGEDGPTHQPIEHVASFRAMPGMMMMRPADGNETAGCYKVAVESRHMPSTLALSRQVVPNLPGTSIEGAAKGGYTIYESAGAPDVILMGTGTELHLAYDAALALEKEGKKVRVVSMCCWELLEKQGAGYIDALLPKSVPKVSIEAGTTFGWAKYADASIGRDDFGASAPAPTLYKEFGITTDAMVAKAKELMA